MQKTKDQLAEYLFHQGTNYRAYTYLGAHRARGGGYVFRVWAPNADAVYLTGDFNGWGADMLMEKSRAESGLRRCRTTGSGSIPNTNSLSSAAVSAVTKIRSVRILLRDGRKDRLDPLYARRL